MTNRWPTGNSSPTVSCQVKTNPGLLKKTYTETISFTLVSMNSHDQNFIIDQQLSNSLTTIGQQIDLNKPCLSKRYWNCFSSNRYCSVSLIFLNMALNFQGMFIFILFIMNQHKPLPITGDSRNTWSEREWNFSRFSVPLSAF